MLAFVRSKCKKDSEITSYVNGGIFLSEKYKELLEQYDIKVLSTFEAAELSSARQSRDLPY